MSAFSADWLELRAPYDHAARSEALARALGAALPRRPLHLVDLACGLGSSARYLAGLLPGPQHWLLVDHDPDLLALAAVPGAASVQRRSLDVRRIDELEGPLDAVTTQALLDLVDAPFLERLAEFTARRRVPLLAALTVDGRVRWLPAHPSDAEVQAAFRLHQRTDRGFGPSPGTDATRVLVDLLRARGYAVRTRCADWAVPRSDRAMLSAMVEGTARAAAEVHPEPARVERWRSDRLAQLHRLELAVGHRDLLAWPRGP